MTRDYLWRAVWLGFDWGKALSPCSCVERRMQVIVADTRMVLGQMYFCKTILGVGCFSEDMLEEFCKGPHGHTPHNFPTHNYIHSHPLLPTFFGTESRLFMDTASHPSTFVNYPSPTSTHPLHSSA
ncbi:hypothetical protein KSP39_PZI002165 [Platanthera zijinensis]|uniref:Uncharacterized protein n=1 Tax=Platanthera zijinensis TaxID=2320716 RepID=A0AAP0C1G2_9ASPA